MQNYFNFLKLLFNFVCLFVCFFCCLWNPRAIVWFPRKRLKWKPNCRIGILCSIVELAFYVHLVFQFFFLLLFFFFLETKQGLCFALWIQCDRKQIYMNRRAEFDIAFLTLWIEIFWPFKNKEDCKILNRINIWKI